MTEYKGIKKDKDPSWSGWYWLRDYCNNKDPLILENDIVLQKMVKSFHFKKTIKILLFNIAIWTSIAYAIYTITKGY